MPKSSRLHNRDHFYKYMDTETALKVLESARLRWSSPLIFNDPFDVPRDIAHGFTPEDITRAVGDLLNHYLDAPPENLTEFDDSLATLLTLARKGFPQELREELRTAIEETAKELAVEGAGLKALRDHWAALLPTMRILCLTESPAHVAMWHHYADRYRGAVLGFRSNDDNDNFLLVAEPVSYLQAKPDVYTDRGLAKLLCLKGNAAARKTFQLGTYTKSDDWSYEKEWRVVTYADAGDLENYSDWPFPSEDLSHIYLGPLISGNDSDRIIALAKRYPNVKVFYTTIGMDRELHFQEHGA